jgi:hypothetical protein
MAEKDKKWITAYVYASYSICSTKTTYGIYMVNDDGTVTRNKLEYTHEDLHVLWCEDDENSLEELVAEFHKGILRCLNDLLTVDFLYDVAQYPDHTIMTFSTARKGDDPKNIVDYSWRERPLTKAERTKFFKAFDKYAQ